MKVVHPEQVGETGGCNTTNHQPEPRMNVHKNARLTPQGRLLMVRRIEQEGWKVAAAAEAAGLSVRRAYHWLARYRGGGERMLDDRSSAPARYPGRVPAERIAEIERLRRQRMSGPAIAQLLGMPRSTVGNLLRRLGLGRLAVLDRPPPAIRYERQRPGELLHIDSKKLGRIDGIGHRITGNRTGQSNRRGTGWEALHVCIDDASRFAYSEVLLDEKTDSALGFLERALSWFKRHGVTVERIMTDNGSAYSSHAFRQACARAGLRHLRTKPYTPRTNGKAERFIQTSLREWGYARAYHTSAERTARLAPWIALYNTRRPHSAIGHQPPFQRLNNLLGNDS
jgi:transposase InsO family protein